MIVQVLLALLCSVAFASDCSTELLARVLGKDPVAHFQRLENQGPTARDSAPTVQKILRDLDLRLQSGSVLELPRFTDYRAQLLKLRETFAGLVAADYPVDATNRAVFKYVRVMSRLLRSADPSIVGQYHREFAKGILNELLTGGDGTRVFFSDLSVGDEYFWNIRPAATYFLWVIDFPPFLSDAKNYAGGPLVDRALATRYIDGLDLDGEEILKHDAGHSFLMQRQDRYLFATLGRSRVELVADWTRNKNRLREVYSQLRARDPELATGVRFLISELIHERGYQFFLPILNQQIQSEKWLEILAFKRKNNYWGRHGMSDGEFARLGEARLWLRDQIQTLTREWNESQLSEGSVLLKRWRPVEVYNGVPLAIEFRGGKDIRVTLEVPGAGIKTASLYEIALVLATPTPLDHAPEITGLEDNILSPVETYKLERVLTLIRQHQATAFTSTRAPDAIVGKVTRREGSRIQFTQESGRKFDFDLSEVSFQPVPAEPVDPPDKYINLDAQARFVDARVLREAYEHFDDSLNAGAPPFVSIPTANGVFELAMVNTEDIRIATAVSSLLTRSLEDAKYTNGGYLPPQIVQRVQTELVSPYGVTHLWGKMGRRFVLSREATDGRREIVASALVGESRDNIFFFTSRFNNLKHSRLQESLDMDLSMDGDPEHRWLDKFDFPEVARYKPQGYHHFANFVVEREGVRGQGLARLMIEEIVKNYSREYLQATRAPITHSQRLLCGKGFWQIGDPPWLARMSSLGFSRRLGAETFHIDQPWSPLVPTYDREGQVIDHVTYNRSFGVPQIYDAGCDLSDTNGDPLLERVSTIIDLALSGRAKLQYFQLLFPFAQMTERGARAEDK